LANEENVLRTVLEFVFKNFEPTKQQVKALSKVLEDVGGESKQVTVAIDQMFKAMGKDTPLKDLKAELKGLSKIYRDEVRKIAGEGGNAADAINVLSPDQQKRVIDLQKAITAATVSESQKREAAREREAKAAQATREREAKAAQAAREREAKAAQAARERESKAVQAAIDKDIAAIERERQARNKSISSQFAQASARDKSQASAARETQSTAQSSRAYNNLSTSIDGTIASRRQESAAFASSLQARLKEEQATNRAAAANNQLTQNLPRLRYALYDVSTSLTIAGAAMLGFSVVALKTAIDYERQFADVIRTSGATGDAIGEMRNEFLELNSTLPISFRELAQIGTLAGQLNIPTADIGEFTELVAKFSATTNVSIEQSATAFGRLRELLGLTSDQFDNLGSSILGVGINSVATESQIIAITTQLAGIASQAGLSADELIGLSAALASVGIQPELARGTITRLFGQISRSVTLGGESLESFGAIAGMSGTDFAKGWANAPVDTLLEFFDGVKARGGDAEAALREVGITSVRDVPAILRLAQTVDTVLRPSLQQASDDFADGNEINRQYGIIAETTAEKLKVLAQNFTLFLNAIGQGGLAFKGLIDLTTDLLRTFTEIAESPIGATVLQTAVIVGLLGGAVLLLTGLLVRGAASILAVRTAMAEMGFAAGGATGGVSGLAGAIFGLTPASVASSAALTRLSTVMRLVPAIAVASTIALLANGLGDMGLAASGASADVDELVQSLGESTEEGGNFGSVLTAIGRTGQLGTSGTAGMKLFTAAFAGLIDDAEAADNAIRILGDSTQAFVNQDFFSEGGNLGFSDFVGNAISPARAEIEKLDQALVSLFAEDQLVAIEAYEQILAQVAASGGDVGAAAAQLNDFNEILANTDPAEAVAQGAAIAAMEVEALRSSMELLIEDIFQVANDSRVMESALGGLGEALFATGAASAFTSSEFQKSIETIVAQSGSSQDAANNLQAFFDALVAGGFASEEELGFLTQTIGGLLALTGKGAKTQVVAPFDLSALRKGFDDATKASNRTGRSAGRIASEVRKANVEVRTLLDYAGDLSKIFSRAFDIRFKSLLAVDGVADTWENLTDRIREARLETDKLTADKAIKEYFLSVAEAYGDELRAGVLRGEIADINEKLTKTQEEASSELEGNTKAARDNRSTITGLVKQYQDYITALAESGADQATLNAAVARSEREFTDQARALGFSNAQLQPYIASFRDMTTVINNVPRNITVTANANPALQALAEYEAALNKARANANQGIPGITTPGLVDTSSIRQAALVAEINALAAQVARMLREGNGPAANAASSVLEIKRNQLRNRNFYSGGFTGRGGKFEPAGIVHRGEYVVPKSQVNQSTGLPHANALGGQMPASRGPSYAGGGMVTGAGMGAGMMVELSPIDRKLLAAAGNVSLSIDGRVISGTVARNNTVDALRGSN